MTTAAIMATASRVSCGEVADTAGEARPPCRRMGWLLVSQSNRASSLTRRYANAATMPQVRVCLGLKVLARLAAGLPAQAGLSVYSPTSLSRVVTRRRPLAWRDPSARTVFG